MTKEYFDAKYNCRVKITVTCGGEPLERPYMPPEWAIRAYGRHLASKYSAKDADWFTPDTEEGN